MRYFTLTNSNGDSFDITTQEYLFHDIGGLGFSEEISYRRMGRVWNIDSVEYAQTPITGNMLFTYLGEDTPYEKYKKFFDFASRAPLILTYQPDGKDGRVFRCKVRLSKMDKGELTELGVLDCPVEFSPYTPWYFEFSYSNFSTGDETSDDEAFIFRDENDETSLPAVFDSDGVDSIRTIFRNEPGPYVTIPDEITNDKDNPIRLTIYGPVADPAWSHTSDGDLVSGGGFADTFTLASGERLVIDSIDGAFSMKVYSDSSSAVDDVYYLRDFDTMCFINLKQGSNTIVVTGDTEGLVKFTVEGHIYHATV